MSVARLRRELSAVLIVLPLAVLLPDFAANAITPPPEPKDLLEKQGLSTDEASLLQYLETGFPDMPRPTSDSYNWNEMRWRLYEQVAAHLAREKSAAAVPAVARLLEFPLPPRVEEHLKEAVASRGVHNSTHDQREWLLLYLQGRVATFLGDMAQPAAVEPLARFARQLLPTLRVPEEQTDTTRQSAFACACISLARLGDSLGAELLVQMLPDVPLHDT